MIPILRAMQRRAVHAVFGVATLSVAGILACSSDSITRVGTRMGLPSGPSRNIVAGASRVLKVCTGNGPGGTYTYQITSIVLGVGTRGTASTPLGTTFNVPSGQCVDAVVMVFDQLLVEVDPLAVAGSGRIPQGISPCPKSPPAKAGRMKARRLHLEPPPCHGGSK